MRLEALLSESTELPTFSYCVFSFWYILILSKFHLVGLSFLENTYLSYNS